MSLLDEYVRQRAQRRQAEHEAELAWLESVRVALQLGFFNVLQASFNELEMETTLGTPVQSTTEQRQQQPPAPAYPGQNTVDSMALYGTFHTLPLHDIDELRLLTYARAEEAAVRARAVGERMVGLEHGERRVLIDLELLRESKNPQAQVDRKIALLLS